MSATDKQLADIRRILAEMSVCAEGATTRFPDAIERTPAEHRTRRKPGDPPRRQHIGKASNSQHGESRPLYLGGSPPESLYDKWKQKLERAVEMGGPGLAMAIAEADVELKVARHAPEDLKSDDERSKLIIQEGEGYSPEQVAARFRCRPAHVRTLRRRWSPDDPRDPETGHPLPTNDPESRRRKAAALKAQGLSARAIAMRLGVTHPTVLSDLEAVKGERAA